MADCNQLETDLAAAQQTLTAAQAAVIDAQAEVLDAQASLYDAQYQASLAQNAIYFIQWQMQQEGCT